MTEIGRGLPAGSDLVPGWLVRLAAIGWRLLATILLGLVLLFIALELATVTASILLAAIVAATFAPYVLTLRQPRMVADQGSGRRLPWRGAGHRRHPGHHRPRLRARMSRNSWMR